jgi:hypothetical protein
VTDYDPGLAELLYGAVADDERLRCDLDDEAYGPLLSWAANRADALATDATEDVDVLAERLRDAVQGLVAVIRGGDPAGVAAIDPGVLPLEDAERIARAVVGVSNDPGERAAVIAHELSGSDA